MTENSNETWRENITQAPPSINHYNNAPQQQQGVNSPYVGSVYSTGSSSNQKDWMGITSLVTSLVGMSLLAVIFGHLGLKAYKNGEASNRGLALAGTIIGWIGVILAFLYFLFVVVVFANTDWVTVY